MKGRLFNLFDENSGSSIIARCPVCNLKYDPVEARILEEKQNVHLAYIKCYNCQAAILALIMNNGMGITSVGLITDLSADEVIKFKSKSTINSNDVIEIHQLLEKQKVLIDYLD